MLIIIYFVDLGENGKNGITIKKRTKKRKKKRRRKRETRSVETNNKQTNKKKNYIYYIYEYRKNAFVGLLCCNVLK